MWPESQRCRANLAYHLVSADSGCQGLDVIEIVEMCARGLVTTCQNGLCHIEGVAIFQQNIVQGIIPLKVPPVSLSCFALHLLWVAYANSPITMAMYIQSRMLIISNAPFWTALYEWTSWILVAPPTIIPGLMVGRPDLAHLCHLGYMELLANCKSSSRVDQLVAKAISGPWDYSIYTDEWRAVSACLTADGVQGFVPIHISCNDDNHDAKATLLQSRLKLKPAIHLNGVPIFCISDTDRIVLLMRQLFCKPFAWAYNMPPATAPVIFHELYAILSNPPEFCGNPIDELTYLPSHILPNHK